MSRKSKARIMASRSSRAFVSRKIDVHFGCGRAAASSALGASTFPKRNWDLDILFYVTSFAS